VIKKKKKNYKEKKKNGRNLEKKGKIKIRNEK
jgi:hypothetical protein